MCEDIGDMASAPAEKDHDPSAMPGSGQPPWWIPDGDAEFVVEAVGCVGVRPDRTS